MDVRQIDDVAGSDRPVGSQMVSDETTSHEPVMVEPVLDYLDVDTTGHYLDGTAGGGGHLAAIARRAGDSAQLTGLDADPEAVERIEDRFQADDRIALIRANFSALPDLVRRGRIDPADGALFDLGLSSDQLDDPARGFSFRDSGPLDMRLSQSGPTARQYIEKITTQQLARDLSEYGDIRSAKPIARSIHAMSRADKLETTADLRRAVEQTPEIDSISDRLLALVFQAIRIAVNGELDALRQLIDNLPDCVKTGGRAVFLTYHSGEDRIVKHGLKALEQDCQCPPGLPYCQCDDQSQAEVLTSSPLEPTDKEKQQNPRSRSAKLRAVRIC